MKLAALHIAAGNIDRARDFHGGRLGLRLASDGRADGFGVFDLDGVDLVVEAVPADAAADEQALVGRFPGISFAVDDVSSAHARRVAAGVRFTGPPERQFWGHTLARLVDPDGNGLQLVQYTPPMHAS